MKKLIIIISMLFSVAYGQTCDTVTNLTFSLVTTSTARVTWTHATNKITYNWALYCLSGCGGIAQQSGNTAGNTLNLSGLNSSFAYQFCITTYCGATSSTPKCSNFTTLSPQIQYTPMTAAGYQFKYVKVDTGFNIPFQDTSLKRGTTRPGALVCNTADSNVYSYNGNYWELLQGVNSAANKVDSVIINSAGDSLFYWINGTSYGQVFGGASSRWSILGNSGTVAGTNFLGTTDNVDLVFKANGIESGRINLDKSNASFGEGALISNNNGSANTAVGYRALFSEANSDNNTAVGNSSLYNNTSGGSNTAFGDQSQYNNIDGGSNTSIGQGSLFGLTSGSQSIGIGYQSGRYNTTQSNRLYINSLNRGNILGDTTLSIIYGYQDATAANQRLYLNSKVYAPYLSTGIPSGAKRLLIGSNGSVYAADTTAGGGSIDTANKWVNTITRTAGKDSIIFYVGTTRYAIKDSVGGGAGAWSTSGDNYTTGRLSVGTSSIYTGATLSIKGVDNVALNGLLFKPNNESISTQMGWGGISSGWVYNILGAGPVSLGTSGAYDATFLTSNAVRMTIASGGSVGIGTTSPDSALTVNTSANIKTNLRVQGTITLTDGANKSVGVSGAMTAGTITISNTRVTANSRIFLTHATLGGTQGILSVGTITAGTSFVINSSSATDTGTVNWFIIN